MRYLNSLNLISFPFSDKSGKMLAACLDQTDGNDFSKTLLFINITLIIICIGTGLYFDISMLIFVKNRNQIQPLQLVPWKSVNPKIEKDDQTVPLWASCVSTATLIFFAILAPVYVELVNTIGEFDHGPLALDGIVVQKISKCHFCSSYQKVPFSVSSSNFWAKLTKKSLSLLNSCVNSALYAKTFNPSSDHIGWKKILLSKLFLIINFHAQPKKF